MIGKIKKILRNDKGISAMVSSLITLLVWVMSILLCIEGIALVHSYIELDEFANELSKTIAAEGADSSNAQIQLRYSELEDIYGISPTYTYNLNDSTDYYVLINGTTEHGVQYGGKILVEVSLQKNAFGVIPINIERNKQVVSQVYWK